MSTQPQTERIHMIEHCRRYPKLTLRDLFKFLYQSAFGCEHLIASPEAVLGYIQAERKSLPPQAQADVEPLAGRYSRVHLGYLAQGLRPETLAALFFRSARREPDGNARLLGLLDAARAEIEAGSIPFSLDEFDSARAEWEAAGFPAMHHSENFRAAYHPAYRVIANDLIPFLPLLSRLDTMLAERPVRLAIEGGSASGKSTLAALLQDIYACTVFHMDDFFLRPEQRTEARFAEPGGNVDRERFLDEVLAPLGQGERVTYRPFDCSVGALSDPITADASRLTVIEGAYSMHPELAGYYDLSVFLHISPELQRARILMRNSPRMAERFFAEWIPLEHRYFDAFDIEAHCDLSIKIDF